MSISFDGYRILRVLLAVTAVAIGLCASASASRAACNYPDAEQVFAKWGDTSYYELAPDGGFEQGGSGWTFSGGAHIVEGNETEYLNGEEDKTALSVPYKGTATSPKVCVDENTPVFRLMTLNGGNKQAKLRVIITYDGAGKEGPGKASGPKARNTEIRADDEWEPTEPLEFDVDGAQERVAQISFTPREGTGDWLVDDLYIDPFSRR
jgi:hypothetical protein